MADLFYRQIQLSVSQIDAIMQLWSVTADGSPSSAPFQNHKDLYDTIDRTLLGDIPWSSFTLQYNGERPADDVPQWMSATFEICYCDLCKVIHDMLGHPSFKDNMDYILYREYHPQTRKRLWQDFMSGDWAWINAVQFFLVHVFFFSNSPLRVTLHDRTKLQWTRQHMGPHLFQ
jgi:hypothetical protein